jgi:hypothetical protein
MQQIGQKVFTLPVFLCIVVVDEMVKLNSGFVREEKREVL